MFRHDTKWLGGPAKGDGGELLLVLMSQIYSKDQYVV
jgi:hypothetical protein